MDATFWATVALFLFFGVMIYFKVPGMLTGGWINAPRRSATI